VHTPTTLHGPHSITIYCIPIYILCVHTIYLYVYVCNLSRGPPLAREQDKTARAEQRGEATEKRTAELEEGGAEFSRTVHSEARPSSSLSEAYGFTLRTCAWAPKGGA
jgi:hypothetical protein